MHYGRRSDLALEAKELFESSAGKTTQLSGVRAREETLFGYPLTRVDIRDETGAEALGKPVGTYLTLEFPALPQGREELLRAARAVAALLGQLPGLPDTGPVFVAGLGNRQMTPDAIGPRTTDLLLITRHLVENLPEEFSGFRPVAALAPGVTGTTGVETGELLAGVITPQSKRCGNKKRENYAQTSCFVWIPVTETFGSPPPPAHRSGCYTRSPRAPSPSGTSADARRPRPTAAPKDPGSARAFCRS